MIVNLIYSIRHIKIILVQKHNKQRTTYKQQQTEKHEIECSIYCSLLIAHN